MTVLEPGDTVGDLLRDWRARRRLSQLALAGDAAISSRHLSFIETGRANGSRETLLKLGDALAMPLRVQNRLLVAGGHAPAHSERPFLDRDMDQARQTVEAILAGHDPYPALAVDRHWTLVAANEGLRSLLTGVAPELLEGPVNVLRLSLHPEGLAPRIVNLAQWRGHVLHRLRRQCDHSGDPVLEALARELAAYPLGDSSSEAGGPTPVAIPLRLRQGDGILSFLATTTVFGTSTDVLLSELALECFYPADGDTRSRLLDAART